MAKKKEPEYNLPSLDDIFSTQEQRDQAEGEKVVYIDFDLIDDFPDHPFKVRDDEEMDKLVDSIKEYGILMPSILRPLENGRYQMVGGHRRKHGGIRAGLTKGPCIVKDLTDDEAAILMVDSNLQREKILPSEKAFAYKIKLEAMRRQGKRSDLTSVPVAQKSERKTSREILGDQVGESQDQIRRYIRLTELIPDILDMVDEGKIALRPAVEISYIPKELQKELHDTMQMEDCTPSHAQALKMRKMLDDDKLTPEVLCSIMQEEKPNQKERIVLRDERVRKLIPKSVPVAQTEEYVIKALEFYGKYRQKQKQQTR